MGDQSLIHLSLYIDFNHKHLQAAKHITKTYKLLQGKVTAHEFLDDKMTVPGDKDVWWYYSSL